MKEISVVHAVIKSRFLDFLALQRKNFPKKQLLCASVIYDPKRHLPSQRNHTKSFLIGQIVSGKSFIIVSCFLKARSHTTRVMGKFI